MKRFREFLDEGARRSLMRLAHHVAHSNIGIITAHRGEYQDAKDEQGRTNKVRNSDLAHDIRTAGFGYVHLRGKYIENYGTPHARPVEEHSFMVIARKEHHRKLKDFLVKHGQKYGQESVLYKRYDDEHAHLIGTGHHPDLKAGESMSVGKFHVNHAPQYHSILRRGTSSKAGKTSPVPRTFAFHEGLEAGVDEFGGRWETFGVYRQHSFFVRTDYAPF